MTENKGLVRFLEAQNQLYLKALAEVQNGKKETHWMWFVFPQIKGLGISEKANFYGLANIAEATDYLAHPVLGKHLIEISSALLSLEDKTASEIFGAPDDLKLRSSMTLFAMITDTNPIFGQIIQKYFNGVPDIKTQTIVAQESTHA